MMARSRMRSSAFGARRISSTMLQVSLMNSFPITGVTMTGSKASSVPVECWRAGGCILEVGVSGASIGFVGGFFVFSNVVRVIDRGIEEGGYFYICAYPCGKSS